LRRLAGGRIALLWNPVVGEANLADLRKMQGLNLPVAYGPRWRLAMATTRDGEGWSDARVLAEDGRNGYCYPAVLQRTDRRLPVCCSCTSAIISPCDPVMIGPFWP
jgi:hypothetical protein